MPLYQVAITKKPSIKEQETGAQEKLILAPVTVVAANPDSAKAAVVQQESKKLEGADLANCDIIARGF